VSSLIPLNQCRRATKDRAARWKFADGRMKSARVVIAGLSMALVAIVAGASARASDQLAPFDVRGDAIEAPLGGLVGDAARGRLIVKDRTIGNCLICHAAPEPDELFMGDVAPPLQGTGSRLTRGQIRLRIVDQSVINPSTVMPPYYRVQGLRNVGPRWRGQPGLTAQQVEDVVAYLATLKD
jgi:sulfur-oxidizing protein SoxX